MRVEYATLVMQILILIIISSSFLYSLRTKRKIGKTLEAIYQYRREIAWMEARLDALEKKNDGRPA
jgi:hypothetical protein